MTITCVLRTAAAGLAAALLFGMTSEAAHAQAYPSKSLRIVVGPGSDVVMRALAQRLSPALGQQVIVEQLPGAGGVIAAQTVAKAAPDGYTLQATTSSFVINDVLRKDAGFSLLRDFEPVGLVGVGSGLLFAPASLKANTLQEFLALAKAAPDTLNCASSGIGTPAHLGCEMLATYGKVVVRHVPYNGLGPAMIDLMAGRVHLVFGLLSSSMIQDQRLKVLAATSKSRNPAAPNAPTVAEAGLPQLEQFRGWNGIHVPKGTPKDVIARLSTEIQSAVASDELKEKIVGAGLEPAGGPVESFAAFVKDDLERWTKVVADTGAKAD